MELSGERSESAGTTGQAASLRRYAPAGRTNERIRIRASEGERIHLEKRKLRAVEWEPGEGQPPPAPR